MALETLQKLGIPTQLLFFKTPHPLTGEPGYWVLSYFWQICREHGVQLWEDPWIFVRYHLEAVVRQNLALLLSIQDVDALIESWRQEERGPALIQEVLPDQSARLRLTKVLRMLLREHVPIVDWEKILETLRDPQALHDKLPELVRTLRLERSHS
jgi:flagellar biosynthesis component FlhA